jgi:hypothetical protein
MTAKGTVGAPTCLYATIIIRTNFEISFSGEHCLTSMALGAIHQLLRIILNSDSKPDS